jgi:hypothetical protein
MAHEPQQSPHLRSLSIPQELFLVSAPAVHESPGDAGGIGQGQ